METEWFIRKKDMGVDGPMSSRVLKQQAEAGIVSRETPVRRGATGQWVPASRVKGLFEVGESDISPRLVSSEEAVLSWISTPGTAPDRVRERQSPSNSAGQQPPTSDSVESSWPEPNTPPSPNVQVAFASSNGVLPPHAAQEPALVPVAGTRRVIWWGVLALCAMVVAAVVVWGGVVYQQGRVREQDDRLAVAQAQARAEQINRSLTAAQVFLDSGEIDNTRKLLLAVRECADATEADRALASALFEKAAKIARDKDSETAWREVFLAVEAGQSVWSMKLLDAYLARPELPESRRVAGDELRATLQKLTSRQRAKTLLESLSDAELRALINGGTPDTDFGLKQQSLVRIQVATLRENVKTELDRRHNLAAQKEEERRRQAAEEKRHQAEQEAEKARQANEAAETARRAMLAAADEEKKARIARSEAAAKRFRQLALESDPQDINSRMSFLKLIAIANAQASGDSTEVASLMNGASLTSQMNTMSRLAHDETCKHLLVQDKELSDLWDAAVDTWTSRGKQYVPSRNRR